MRLAILTLSITIFVCSALQAQWTELNPRDHLFNNTIFTTIADKTGKVYAAGLFTDSAGQYTVSTLSNGVWKNLGGGAALAANGPIYTLALDSSGNLFAGGAFSNTSGNYYVAKWNGSQWSELGTGAASLNATGQIFCLATDKAGNVYAGGALADQSGNYYLSRWNGQGWSTIGTGTHSLNANGTISAILPDTSGNVYVAGHFTDAGGNYYVAKWNGSDWNGTGTGAGALNADSYINALTVDRAGNIYAAGDFKDASSQQYVAKWNGTSWAGVGAGSMALQGNGTINALIIDRDTLTAAGWFTGPSGNYTIARWIGAGWTELPGTTGVWPPNKSITTIASNQYDHLYAAGDFTDINGDRYVATLTNGVWSEPGGLGGTKFPKQANPMRAMAVDTAGHVFVVLGDMDLAGIPIVMRWDGTKWNQLSTVVGNGYASVSGLAADSLGNVYACGSFGAGPGAAKWTGTAWTMLPFSNGQLTVYSLSNVATDKKGNVYLSGSFEQGGSSYGIVKWDGSSWTGYSGAAEVYYFIVDSAGTIYGANTDFDYHAYNVLKIKGASVTPIGGTGAQPLNANTWVQAMVLDSAGNLYAGGGFSDSVGNPYVAKWNGTAWTTLGTGPAALQANGSITGLAFDKADNLYISGSLQHNSGTYLGKWDGQTWSAISDGPEFQFQNEIPFLQRDGRGIIYAGGQFQGSGGINNYIYSYGGSNIVTPPPVVCNTAAHVTLRASQTDVTTQTGTIIVTATPSDTAGLINTVFEYASDRNFNTILRSSSPDSVLSVDVANLASGANVFFVLMQTADACGNTLTSIDSILINKNIVSGITDVDFPNTPIVAFPNPMDKFLQVTGLNAAKSYTIMLRSGSGATVRALRISGETTIQIGAADLPRGMYWLEVYDNTRKRRLGEAALLKVR